MPYLNVEVLVEYLQIVMEASKIGILGASLVHSQISASRKSDAHVSETQTSAIRYGTSLTEETHFLSINFLSPFDKASAYILYHFILTEVSSPQNTFRLCRHLDHGNQINATDT